jgi:hypothetical protein
MAKIQITEGTWNTDCTSELNLTNAHAKDPSAGYDKVIMYAEKRYLMTFITAGATNGAFTAARTTDAYKTRIPTIPSGELIDGKAWRYHIMGRIQKASLINSLIGVPSVGTDKAGGFFQLSLRDNYIQPDMNVIFYNGKMAKSTGTPTGTEGNYIYRFQCYPGDTFDWNTWIAPQTGQKTCFGGFSMHGERSIRGYGRVHYPQSFINHMTIQRKSIGLTGDANAERVLWYVTQNKSGELGRGWGFWLESQARTQFLLEDEFQKWWGKSTMKDAFGNLLASPSMIDEETGFPITAGDGWYEQVKGANDMEASGSDGSFTWDDLSDMITALKKKSNESTGKLFYAVTGSDGMATASALAAQYAKDNYNITQNIEAPGNIGGFGPAIGYTFDRININGNQIYFVENPMMDDELKFPRRLTNGKLAMSNTVYFVDATPDDVGKPNVEIRTRGRGSINRNMVYYYLNGMTGDGQPFTSVDAKEFHMLKENMMVVYNTRTNGILTPASTA